MKTASVSARLTPDTAKKIALLAKALNRSKSYLAAEAIEAYVNDQQWQIEAIVEGIRQARRTERAWMMSSSERQIEKALAKCGHG